MRRIGLFVVLCFGLLPVFSGCGGSNAFSPANPTPNVTSIHPSSLAAGSSAQTVTVHGNGSIASMQGAAATVMVSGPGFEANSVAKVSVTNPGLAPARPVPLY